MEGKFENKLAELYNEITETLTRIIDKHGQKSKHCSEMVIKPDDDFCFDIPNVHYKGWVEELTPNELICNYGYKYPISGGLEIGTMCEIVDHLIEKVQRQYIVKTEEDVDGQMTDRFEFFVDVNDAIDFYEDKVEKLNSPEEIWLIGQRGDGETYEIMHHEIKD